MKTAVLALALSLTPVAAEAWAPRPMPSLHKSAPMRAEAAVAVTGGSDARAGPAFKIIGAKFKFVFGSKMLIFMKFIKYFVLFFFTFLNSCLFTIFRYGRSCIFWRQYIT